MVRSRTRLIGGHAVLIQHAEWVKVPFLQTIQHVICRSTNRIFVGAPLCSRSLSSPSTSLTLFIFFFSGRDRDYQDLNVSFAVHVSKLAKTIGWFPKPLKPCVVPYTRVSLSIKPHFSIVSRMFSKLPSQVQKEAEFIKPMVQERFAKMEEYGEDWDDKPVCWTIAYGVSLITITWPIYRTICSCGT
jgi:hypothetical protein